MNTRLWMAGFCALAVVLGALPLASATGPNVGPVGVQKCDLGANATVNGEPVIGLCCRYVPWAHAYACE